MNMFEEAKSLDGMLKMRKLSQTEAAKMLGVSQSYVANKLRLLGLDEELQGKIVAAGLTERHARAMLRLKSKEDQQKALDIICERRFSVAETDALVDFMKTSELSTMIGRADRIRGIDFFLTETKKSLSALSSIGVNTSHKISYRGNKIIATFCIESD